MKTNLSKYNCGNCGCDEYWLFHDNTEHVILTECTKCSCVSKITHNQTEYPKITVKWGDDNEMGVMCKSS